MRLAMTQDIDVLVAVGGKPHPDTGINPGVLEELAHARWHSAPCFVVGAFSGAAGHLDHSILEELCAGNLLGTSAVGMVDLATWTDMMDEYVGKLLAHLARHKEQFSKPRQIEDSPSSVKFSIQSDDTVETTSAVVRVVNVDPLVPAAWSARFVGLMDAFERKDTNQARKLLRTMDFLKAT